MDILRRMTSVEVLMVVVMSLFAAVLANSDPSCLEDWHPMDFSMMFTRPAIKGLIQATVIDVYPPQYVAAYDRDVITARVRLECVYRGSSWLEQLEYANVTGFGDNGDCVTTMVQPNRSYLMFVDRFSHPQDEIQLVIQEYNVQRGAYQANGVKRAIVNSEYECREPQSGATTTLRPWRSLTPVKQVSWIILPENYVAPNRENAASTPGTARQLLLAVTSACIAKSLLEFLLLTA